MENITDRPATKEQAGVKLPKIEYDKSLLNPECPYTISVDQQGCAKLLELAGVKPNNIDSITILFQRKQNWINNLPTLVYGDYNPRTKKIRIFTDDWWKKQEKIIKKANKILEETEEKSEKSLNMNNKKSFSEIALGKKLSWFSTIILPEKARKMIEKISETKTDKEIDDILYHEAKHAGDFSADKFLAAKETAISIVANLASFEGVSALTAFLNPNAISEVNIVCRCVASIIFGYHIYYYLLSPSEKKARKLAKELGGLPKFRLITIAPKNK